MSAMPIINVISALERISNAIQLLGDFMPPHSDGNVVTGFQTRGRRFFGSLVAP